jgi:hypothetical protein
MASSSEAAEGLEAAIAAIPRIAEVIAAIPVEDRARAFGMARRLYLQTAHDLGGGEAAARNLVSTVMRHLLLQVAERDAAKQKMLKAIASRTVAGRGRVRHQRHLEPRTGNGCWLLAS